MKASIPEGNMLRCAAAALSFLSTSEREAKLFPVPVFRRKSNYLNKTSQTHIAYFSWQERYLKW